MTRLHALRARLAHLARLFKSRTVLYRELAELGDRVVLAEQNAALLEGLYTERGRELERAKFDAAEQQRKCAQATRNFLAAQVECETRQAKVDDLTVKLKDLSRVFLGKVVE